VNRKFYILIFTLSAFFSFSQEGKTEKEYDPKEEVVYDGKRFRVWNNYITLGGMPGASINSNIPTSQFAGALDFNYHIQTNYFQTGILMSGNEFGNYNNTQFHMCWGKRIEKNRYHFAAFGGIDYSLFYWWEKDSVPARFVTPAKTAIGAYAVIQNYWKFKYDVGIGCSVFASYNTYRYLVGARIELYFSTAYRGEKKGRKKVE
jgi:hypothetical protein